MPDHSFYITTPRLAITYFNPALESHIAFTLELYKDYRTTDAAGNTVPTIPDRAAALKMMEDRCAQIDESGFGRYCVSVLPETEDDAASRVKHATPVGLVGLNLRSPDTPPFPDIGFNLLPSTRGKGYATEAAEALLAYYAREKGVTQVLGYCDDDNAASKAVLRRSGFTLLGERSVAPLTSPGQVHGGPARPEKVLVWTRGFEGEGELVKFWR